MWHLGGWLGGIALAYGVGSSLIPEPKFMVSATIIFGAGMLGAILGKIANR